MKLFVACLISLLFTAFALAQHPNTMQIVAHRGNSSKAPENTLAAFELAIVEKADYFECDVRKSKDGKLVVIHDETVDRTTNGSGLVEEMPLNELQKLSAGFSEEFGNQFVNEKIPTLEETLKLAKNRIKVEIEIKSKGLAQDVVFLVKTLKMNAEVIIISFDYDELVKIKELAPDIETMFLVGALWSKKELEKVAALGGEYLGPNGIPTKRKVKMAHIMGIKILPYTINEKKLIQKALMNGVDGIATDCPARAYKLRS
ncbi:MAG: glycerophosphodiester phosphodiesterase [Bacteroidia bacterium]